MAESTENNPPARARRGSWLLLVLGVIVGGLGALLLVVVVGMPLALGHRTNLPLETLYGNFAVSVAARLQAGAAQNPLGQNPRALESGRLAYTGSCSVCHGANGDGKGIFYEHARRPLNGAPSKQVTLSPDGTSGAPPAFDS